MRITIPKNYNHAQVAKLLAQEIGKSGWKHSDLIFQMALRYATNQQTAGDEAAVKDGEDPQWKYRVKARAEGVQ